MTLGLGAGWQEREHDNFGWDLLEVEARFERFKEGLETITRLLESDEPVDFEGQYYQLDGAILLPRPARSGGPPILIGGNGMQKTLPLAAQYAQEWNGVFLSPDEFSKRNRRLNELLDSQGRDRSTVRRSVMTGCIFGTSEAQVIEKVNNRTGGKRTAGELRQRGLVVGTSAPIVDQLGQLNEAGVQRVMLQWLDLDDLDGLEAMATGVLSQLK